MTRKHLGGLLDRLFAEFTGLHFHIAWAPATVPEWNARSLPTGCSECCRIAGTKLEALPICQRCGPNQLAHALSAAGNGLSFKCRLGVLNHWFPIRVRDVTIGIAYLQALDRAQTRARRRRRTAGAAARILSQSDFRRAGRLLRLMIQHVQTLDLAELRKADLTNAGRAVLALEKEQGRLHEALQRHLPAPPPVALRAGTESHPEQIVHELMACIERDYATPLTLHDCARKLGMNAAYLSALFSHLVGRPFKACLTELRLQKAQQLLGDANQNVSAVAFAVGYTSENRFRAAFKKATGLAPKMWRATMQVNPPPASP